MLGRDYGGSVELSFTTEIEVKQMISLTGLPTGPVIIDDSSISSNNRYEKRIDFAVGRNGVGEFSPYTITLNSGNPSNDWGAYCLEHQNNSVDAKLRVLTWFHAEEWSAGFGGGYMKHGIPIGSKTSKPLSSEFKNDDKNEGITFSVRVEYYNSVPAGVYSNVMTLVVAAK